ncbi:MAG: hypothetical protein Q8R43_00065, partial [Alphaproteobacteria bacterium]|nr:hypothetical protein [Alphaproteobacteria bacterium]
MNSFLKSKIGLSFFAVAVLAFILTIAILLDINKTSLMLMSLALITFSLLLGLSLYKTFHSLAVIPTYLSEWTKGSLQKRFSNITDESIIADIKWGLNDFIDVVDALNRETINSMRAIENHKYYRKILSEGLGGAFQDNAQNINGTIEKSYYGVIDATDHAETLLQCAENTLEKTSSAEVKAESAVNMTNTLFTAVSQLSSAISEIS